MQKFKKSKMELLMVSIAVLISSTIAQTEKNEADLSSQLDTEYHNVEHLLASLDDAGLQELPNDPTCLERVLRSGTSKIRIITKYFKNWMYQNDTSTSTSKPDLGQISDHFNHSRISLDSNDTNTIIRKLQDINLLLNLAINTIRYIREDFNVELKKDQVQDIYDVEGELKMECDALKGILGITTQLARRLMPPRIRQMMVPPRNLIIRLMEKILKLKPN